MSIVKIVLSNKFPEERIYPHEFFGDIETI